MMAQTTPFDIQFIDLSGLDEWERKSILSSLHTINPNVHLPWVKEGVYALKAKVAIPAAVNGIRRLPGVAYGPPGCLAKIGTPPVSFTYVTPFKVNGNTENGHCNYQHVNGVLEEDNHSQKEKNLHPSLNGTLQETVLKKEEEKSPVNKGTMLWSSLLKKGQEEVKVAASEIKPKEQVVLPKKILPDVILKEPFNSNRDDPNLHRMGEFLSGYSIDSRITSLQPRGLINRSNYCYINSILQALMACPPVYNLFFGLAGSLNLVTQKQKITPIIDSMIRLIKEFQHLPLGQRVNRRSSKIPKDKQPQVVVNCDTPFEAHWMNTIFNGVRSDTFIVEGRQEDAEEFFGCLLNGLNDEMLELLKLVGAQQNSNEEESGPEEDKEWQVMGPKNKGSITRRTELNKTPIIDIFGGLLRSRVHRAGDQTTDNIQPFFTLQLNVEKSQNIRDALEHLATKNQLEGITSLKTNEEIEAWQQVTLEKLPLVLVFHVKCFDYQGDGCSKITKALEFPIDLKIEPKILTGNYGIKERQYKLFAVVYHEGKEATKGHYVTDAYHVGYSSWLHYDDASVKPIPEEWVLKPGGTRVPYLLFYRRNDTISTGSNNGNGNNNNKK